LPRPLARYCGCPSCCVISTVVGVKNTSSCCRHFWAASSDSSAGGRADAPRQPQPRIRTQRHDRCRPSRCCCHFLQPVTVAAPLVDLFPICWCKKHQFALLPLFSSSIRGLVGGWESRGCSKATTVSALTRKPSSAIGRGYEEDTYRC
jgi:hypothetical protein